MDKQYIERFDNPAAMQAWAAKLLGAIPGGTLLLLEGELGAGKTTFTQGIAKALGIEGEVSSPTFTIVSHYDVPHNPSFTTLTHVDLYRLEEGQVAGEGMIKEVLTQSVLPKSLTIIEWADRLGEVSLPHVWRLKFTHGEQDSERIVEVNPPLHA